MRCSGTDNVLDSLLQTERILPASVGKTLELITWKQKSGLLGSNAWKEGDICLPFALRTSLSNFRWNLLPAEGSERKRHKSTILKTNMQV